ncbi:uncharacterized protein CTRU02_207486 [Colletotrichum truncatum]|uniref:Uncharacterized protein n=1 Tax=Colletotrichum truncatum TaxID=5467 RepID=A0ACC3Z170_COLTU
MKSPKLRLLVQNPQRLSHSQEYAEENTLQKLKSLFRNIVQNHDISGLDEVLLLCRDPEKSDDEHTTIDTFFNDIVTKIIKDASQRRNALEKTKLEVEHLVAAQLDLQKKNQPLEEAEKEKDARIREVESEAREAKQARDSYHEQLKSVSEKYVSERDQARELLEVANQKLHEAIEERDTKEVRLQRLQAEYTALQQTQQSISLADVEQLKSKVTELGERLREERETNAEAHRDFEREKARWRQKEAEYREGQQYSDEVFGRNAKEKEELESKIDSLKQQLGEERRKVAATRPETMTFLIDGKQVPLKQYEKLLTNVRGQNEELKRQIEQIKEEREIVQEVPLDDVRTVVEPFLKIYGIAFDNALSALHSSLIEEEEILEELCNDDGFLPYPRATVTTEAEVEHSQTSPSGSVDARRGHELESVNKTFSQDLRTELGGLSLSREGSMDSELPLEDTQPDEGNTADTPNYPGNLFGLRERLKQTIKHLHSLKNEKRDCEKEIERLQEEIENLKGKITFHESTAETLKKEIERCTADMEIMERRDRSEQDQKKLDEKQALITSLSLDLRECKTKLATVTNQRDSLLQQIEEAQGELKMWQTSGEEIGNINVALKQDIIENECALAEKEAYSKALEEEVAELKAKLRHARFREKEERARRVEVENNGVWEGTRGAALRDRENKIDQLKLAVGEYEHDLCAKEEEIKALKSDKDQLRNSLDAAWKQVSDILGQSQTTSNDHVRTATGHTQESPTQNLSQDVNSQADPIHQTDFEKLQPALEKLGKLLQLDERIIDSFHQILVSIQSQPRQPHAAVSQTPSQDSDGPRNSQTLQVENPELGMDPRERQLYKMRQLIEVRQTLAGLRSRKELSWNELVISQPRDLYLLDLHLGQLEERVLAIENGRGEPEDSLETLNIEAADIRERMDDIRSMMDRRAGLVRQEIDVHGPVFNDLFRELDNPPSPRPLLPPVSVAREDIGGVEEPPLPPVPGLSSAQDARDKWKTRSNAYAFPGGGDSGEDSSDDDSDESKDHRSRNRYQAEVDTAHIALNRLHTSIDVAIASAAAVRNVQYEATQDVADGYFTPAGQRSVAQSTLDSEAENSQLSPSVGTDGAGSSVFDRSTRGRHFTSMFPVRLTTALREWHNHAFDIHNRVTEVSQAVERLVSHGVNADAYDLMRSRARQLLIERNEAREMLKNRDQNWPLPLENKLERELNEQIRYLRNMVDSLEKKLVEGETGMQMLEHQKMENVRLRAMNEVKDTLLRQAEEETDKVIEEKIRVSEYDKLQLMEKLETAQQKISDLQRKLDLEMQSRSAPIEHMQERVRDLEKQLTNAERLKRNTEDAQKTIFVNLQRAVAMKDDDDGVRIRGVIANIIHPDENPLEQEETESDSDAENEMPERERVLERRLRGMKKVWRIQDDQYKELQEQAEARLKSLEASLQKVIAEREKRLALKQSEFELSEDNRIAAAEQNSVLNERITELEKQLQEQYDLLADVVQEQDESNSKSKSIRKPGLKKEDTKSSASSSDSESDDQGPPPTNDRPHREPADSQSPPSPDDEASGEPTSDEARSSSEEPQHQPGDNLMDVAALQLHTTPKNPREQREVMAPQRKIRLEEASDSNGPDPASPVVLRTTQGDSNYAWLVCHAIGRCFLTHILSWGYVLRFLLLVALNLPARAVGKGFDLGAKRPLPKNSSVFLVDIIWVVGAWHVFKGFLAMKAVREVWGLANDMSRAYYIESRLKPSNSRYLGIEGLDSRLSPSFGFVTRALLRETLEMGMKMTG